VLQFYNYRLDVFVANYYVGPAGVGLYNVSARMAEALWFLPNSVGFVIFPRAAASTSETMNRFTPRVFRATLAITVLGAIALALLGRFFIRVVYTAEFLGAYLPMLVLLPGVALLGGGKVLTNEIAGRGYPHYNSINAALALVLTLILDLVLIPRYGIVGAALASTVSYSAIFVMAVLFYWIVSRENAIETAPAVEQTGLANPSGLAARAEPKFSSTRTGNQE
jgi:O-antigen/teichoic acid export membrane protein